jgi:hypothetical protein
VSEATKRCPLTGRPLCPQCGTTEGVHGGCSCGYLKGWTPKESGKGERVSTEEKCPECGSELCKRLSSGLVIYDCGTTNDYGKLDRHDTCKHRVLTALRRENAELAAKLAEATGEMGSMDLYIVQLREQLDAAMKFKAYTHQRMTEAGVPEVVPESPHTAVGCRIGGRFDWLLKQLEDARKDFHAQWIQKMKVVDAVKTPDKLFASQLECAAADAVRDLQAKLAAAESREAALREALTWVNAEERLPPFGSYALCQFGSEILGAGVGVCKLTGNDFLSEWIFANKFSVHVMHWMDLSALLSRPEPTKEDGDV